MVSYCYIQIPKFPVILHHSYLYNNSTSVGVTNQYIRFPSTRRTSHSICFFKPHTQSTGTQIQMVADFWGSRYISAQPTCKITHISIVCAPTKFGYSATFSERVPVTSLPLKLRPITCGYHGHCLKKTTLVNNQSTTPCLPLKKSAIFVLHSCPSSIVVLFI